MNRNVLVILIALVVGLGLAWAFLGPSPGGGEGGDLDRTSGGPDEAGELLASGADRAGDEGRGPVLFGRPRALRVGRGGVTGRVARVEDDTAIEGAQLVLAGTGHGGEQVALRGTTASDGRFTLAEVPAGDAYDLQIVATDLPDRAWPAVMVRDGSLTDLGTIWLGEQIPFEGRVVGPAGRGIAGADVRVHVGHFSFLELLGNFTELFSELDREPEPLARTTTSGDGRFSFFAMDPGPVTLVVRAAGYAAVNVATVVAPESESTKPLIVRLAEGSVIAGQVVDASGRGLAGARIAVTQENDPLSFVYGRVFAESDSDGSFRIDTATATTTLLLLASCPGYPMAMVKVESGVEDVRIVLERGATLVCRFLSQPDDEPLEGASVMLSVSESGSMMSEEQTVGTGSTDATGRIAFEVNPGKLQMVWVAHPERGSGVWAGGQQSAFVPGMMQGPEDATIEKGRREIVFRMADTVLIKGRVQDEDGNGIAGASVAPFTGFQLGRAAYADETGTFELRMARSMFAVLMVKAKGYVTGQESVSLQDAPETEMEKEITLVRAAVVTGRVVNQRGLPIAGAEVRCEAVEDEASFDLGMLDAFSGMTGRNGRYMLDGVPPGKAMRVLARRAGYVDASSKNFEVTSGGSARAKDVVLTEGASLDVSVVDPTGRPVAGAAVEFTFERKDEITWDFWGAFRGDGRRRADGGGRVLQENVPSCEATITASHPDWASGSSTATITEEGDAPVRVTVRLRTPMTIGGVVLGEDGAPLEGALVTAVQEDEGMRAERTDARGRFELKGLPEGRTAVRATLPGYEATTLHVERVTEGLEIRLRKESGDRAARREAVMLELQRVGERLRDATSDAERQALQQELQQLSLQWQALQDPDPEASAYEPENAPVEADVPSEAYPVEEIEDR